MNPRIASITPSAGFIEVRESYVVTQMGRMERNTWGGLRRDVTVVTLGKLPRSPPSQKRYLRRFPSVDRTNTNRLSSYYYPYVNKNTNTVTIT